MFPPSLNHIWNKIRSIKLFFFFTLMCWKHFRNNLWNYHSGSLRIQKILWIFHYLFCCPTKHQILRYDRFLDPGLWAPYMGRASLTDFLETKTQIVMLQTHLTMNYEEEGIQVFSFLLFLKLCTHASLHFFIKLRNSIIKFSIYF